MHLLTPYTHKTNQSVNGNSLWETDNVRPRTPVSSVAPQFLPDQPDPDSDWCPLPILHHEPFNTWESWGFWNVTSHLLRAGASFCTAPEGDRRQLFAGWKEMMLDVQQKHRASNAFIVYSSAYEAPCRSLQHLWALRNLTEVRGASWSNELLSHPHAQSQA